MIVYRELSSIEQDLGIPAKTLYALSNNLKHHYHTAELPKRSGGYRTLSVPDESLKRVQRAIADKLLPLEPVSRYATAYLPGKSILSNARPHVGKERVLKLDIHAFFDSIRYIDVKNRAFPAARYAESIRILLSMLCYYQDALPQGAPTSPAISNIVLCDFDNEVGSFCRTRRITYTRYCDDMTFSGSITDERELIAFVETALRKQGFLLNKKKTRSLTASHRQSVTGIVVNQKPNVTKEYKRAIRSEVYYLQKHGIAAHLAKLQSAQTPAEYLDSLLGRIHFVLQICPEDRVFLNYRSTVLELRRAL